MRITNGIISVFKRHMHGESLKSRSLRGVLALGTGDVAGRGLHLIRNMILARILAKDEFGLMALVLVADAAFETLAEVGVRQSIIHNRQGGDERYLNVAWWFQAFRGLCLFVVGYLAVPFIASFYAKPRLVLLLRVALLAVLFRGLISPRAYVLEKKMQFWRWVLWQRGSTVVATLVTIGLAVFVTQSVWALVIGFVSELFLRFLLSFVLCPFLPSTGIDRESLKELLCYARKMLGVPLLALVAMKLDVIVLGKVVTDEQLGMYSMAFLLALQPCGLLSRVFHPVLLSVFAEKQGDSKGIQRIVLEVTRLITLFAMPVTVFLALCGTSVLSVVYTPEYAPVASAFALLCGFSLIRSQSAVLSQVYLGIGRPDLHRRFVILRVILLGLLLYPASVKFGLMGAAASVLLANALSLLMQAYWMRETIDLCFGRYALSWVPGIVLALIVIVPVAPIALFCDRQWFLSLVLGAVCCLAAWSVGLLLLLKRPLLLQLGPAVGIRE